MKHLETSAIEDATEITTKIELFADIATITFAVLIHNQAAFINFFSQQYTAPGSSTLTTTPAGPTNVGGMGAAGGFRPNRTMQWSMRFEF